MTDTKNQADIGPKNFAEELTFAAERFRVDVQTQIHTLMLNKEVDRTELAERLGWTVACVDEIFSDDCPITVRHVATICHALGETCILDYAQMPPYSPLNR